MFKIFYENNSVLGTFLLFCFLNLYKYIIKFYTLIFDIRFFFKVLTFPPKQSNNIYV